jgi:SAM-dependent methyltransferase
MDTQEIEKVAAEAAPSVEQAVRQRYERGAREVETALCCPVTYDSKLLEALPEEIIAKDYGCGDPTSHLRPGDTVLDLGSGAGKICYIASQIVGTEGRVIGVDFNDEMLTVARRHLQAVGARIGYHNVEFRKGRIQDLKLDMDLVDEHLRRHPVTSSTDLVRLREYEDEIRAGRPLVADDSVDVIVSNCVLNLVRTDGKRAMFTEMFRVLKRGGRVAISDIVADEPVPEPLKNDPELWSGCISGAFVEEEFLRAFEEAGFHAIAIETWASAPFAVLGGIEFRSVTVTAHKGKQGPCWERNQAVIYKGPWSQVTDDDHHVLRRGERVAVCEKTFDLLRNGPYRDSIIFIEPRQPVAPQAAQPFDCSRTGKRHPRESKGLEYEVTKRPAGEACGPDGCC